MATIRQGLYEYLKAQPAITAIVGDRIYPIQAPNSAKRPYVILITTGLRSEPHLTAASRLARGEFDIDCWADSLSAAQNLSEAIRNELDGYQGLMGTVDCRRAIVNDQFDFTEQLKDGSERPAFRIKFDVDIWHFTSVPTFS